MAKTETLKWEGPEFQRFISSKCLNAIRIDANELVRRKQGFDLWPYASREAVKFFAPQVPEAQTHDPWWWFAYQHTFREIGIFGDDDPLLHLREFP